ncbi:hypothetical protein NEOKW01_0869 [Nematocida sp. AWRm80]|nr:hypothetical protein NEOKW01_0869 [Nematocida sp. AWRm80]
MSKVTKKESKLIEAVSKVVEVQKIEGHHDFYLRMKNTPFAIRNVQALHIKDTNCLLVLGKLDLASKTVSQLSQYNEQVPQMNYPEQEQPEDTKDKDTKEEETIELTKEDISIVMEQAGISEEEAIKALKENNGDPLSALLALGK